MDPLNEATTDDAPLSISEAVAAYTQPTDEADNGQSEDDTGEEGDQLDTGDETLEGEVEGDEQTDDEGQPDDDSAEGQDEAEAEEEQEAEEVGGGRFAADDAKVRMPDGTFLTVAQLKSGNLMDRDYRQKTMALAEEKKTLATESEAVAQTKTQLADQQTYMVELLQSLLPKIPSFSTDPMGHMAAKEQHEQFMQHLNYIQQQQDAGKAADTAKQQETRAGHINTEFGRLLEKVPALQDPAKLQSFEADIIAAGADYGFSRDEIAAQVPMDHRMALALRDAHAWRKLQASKAKVQDKTPPKRPPVQKGGKRQTPGAIQARTQKAAMERLEQSGSLRDGVAAFLATQNSG